MDITNSIRLYAECLSNNAITEPTGGSWISAIAIYQGSTEPLNGSWLQRVCDNLGITAPVNGSWTIALANYYGISAPVNGTWWFAIQDDVCNGIPTDLIWNTVQALWNLEQGLWKDAQAPAAPTNDGGTFNTNLPLITGTGTDGLEVRVEVDGYLYTNITVSGGVWSLQTTEILAGSASPGTQYQVTSKQYDASTGLESVADLTDIFIVSTSTSITFDLFDSYGDGWNEGWMQLEEETAPGVWTAIDLPNYQTYGRYLNAAYTGNLVLYWNQGSFPTGTTGMKFETYDPLSAPPNSPGRSWLSLVDTYIFDLDPANYRLTSGAVGSYTGERTVTVKETIGGAVIATVSTSANWTVGNTLATFTIS